MGGTAQVVDSSFLEASYEGKVEIRNRNVVRNSDGQMMAMGRNMAVLILDEAGKERASHRVTYGSRIFVDDGDKVKRGQRIAEWDPYTRPVLTEIEGNVAFEDLVDGISVQETADESTGITKREVIDWRSTPRGSDLKPALTVLDAKGKVGKLAKGGDARFLLSVEAILSVEPGAHVKPGDVLARIPMESAKTKDITGGLPRVAELFEARRPKDHAIIAEIDGTIRFGRDYKNKRRIIIEPHDSTLEPVEYLIPKGKPFHLQDGDAIEKGDYVLDGNPAPHDILAIKGVEALASYLVNEIQEVYRLQGVLINDKHIEVIVRQMLQKVEITEQGDFDLHRGRPCRRDRARRGQRAPGRGRQEAGRGPAGAARHHQGLAADAVLHLRRLLPGDDAGADGSGGCRQDRHAAGPQGKRHRRPADPGRHRRHDEPDPAHRDLARRADPRRAPQGVRRGSGRTDADGHDQRRRVSGRTGRMRKAAGQPGGLFQ